MIKDPFFNDKKILLIDKERKIENDRTWCFWEKGEGAFEKVVFRHWDKVWFYGTEYAELLQLKPYQYKMIRGIDFYRHCQQIIDAAPNVKQAYAPVKKMEDSKEGVIVTAGEISYQGKYIFNSILFQPPVIKTGEYHLLQHFMGWVIDAAPGSFNPAEPVLMDFRQHQSNGTTFVYVMPLSDSWALVEYTVFSEKVLPENIYRDELKSYISQRIKLADYNVAEEEFGVIPMTNFRFKQRQGNMLNIGTAGGQTKASSGYTFRSIQKQTSQIISSLKQKGHPFHLDNNGAGRFMWFDSVLLNILHNKTLEGKDIFSDLFRKNETSTLLSFLDNETRPAQELKIMWSVPAWPFMKAGIAEWLKSLR
jgi:lycopene beta-cyclase